MSEEQEKYIINKKLSFALIGAAGYVAPKHMKAIKEVGGELVAVLDPHDSVRILDSFFPGCHYFSEYERFERFLDKTEISYLSICSPNYLHDSHCRLGLRNCADVICEKPVTCTINNFNDLTEWQEGACLFVWPVLQLRYHPEVIRIKNWLKSDEKYHVQIDYVTHRGPWYDYSWKSNIEKSGGLATNIGIHLFDLCCMLFGKYMAVNVVYSDPHKVKGNLMMQNADVGFFLSISYDSPIRREITIKALSSGETISLELTKGFHDLHTEVYRRIIENDNPVPLSEARQAIQICEDIRNAKK
jgi:UDP-N-acetyl-2-amino-2-deoxyglucuronate dehydrogenase